MLCFVTSSTKGLESVVCSERDANGEGRHARKRRGPTLLISNNLRLANPDLMAKYFLSSLYGVTVRLAVCVAPLVPEIVTAVVVDTVLVVTVNVAVFCPAATVTLAGTVAAPVLLLDSVTAAPPDAAGPFSVTVPVDGAGPFTVVGLRVRELSVGAVTVKTAVLATPRVAVIVTEAFDATGLVVIVKVVVVALAGTVTVAGTCAAAALLLESVTTAPPAGAGPLSVTVPVDEMLPTTDDGLRISALMAGVLTVKVPEFVLV